MRRPTKTLVFSALLATAAPAAGGAQTLDRPAQTTPAARLAPSPIDIADSLFLASNVQRALAVLSDRLDVAPDDFEALWRGTRAAVALGILTEDRSRKLQMLRLADHYADRLLALRPNGPLALEWAVAAKGRLAIDDHNPVTTAKLGKEVWKLSGTLLAEQPGNPMANDARGVVIREIRKLSWGERILARVLVGRDVANAAHWEDAERYLRRAVSGDPAMVVYRLDLGDVYRLQGKDAQALRAYRDGLALPDRLPVDAYYKRRIRARLDIMGKRGVSASSKVSGRADLPGAMR